MDVRLIEAGTMVFPVYAGVIPVVPLIGYVSSCVPRVCGGDPKKIG